MPSAASQSSRRALLAILAGGVIMGLALGTRHVQGLFLLPITFDRTWPREAFGFAIAAQNLVWGMAQPFTGMIADRFGSRLVIGIGTAAYGLGLFLMTVSGSEGAFALSAGLIIGIGLSGTAFGAIYGAISRIVPPEKAAWALGLAGAVGGLGQFLMVPGVQFMIGSLGWTGALTAIAIVFAVAITLSFALDDRKPLPGAAAPSTQTLVEALSEAFQHKGFWLLMVGFTACGFQLAFISVHMPAYLVDKGLTTRDGVVSLAIIALTNVIGTYYSGIIGGIMRRKFVLAWVYAIRAIAIVLFYLIPISPLSVYVFSAAMGLLWLGTAPLTNGLVSQVFGVKYISTLFGFVFLGHQIGGFLGVWLGAYVFDMTHSYGIVWSIAIALGFASAAFHWPIDDRPLERQYATV